VEHVKEHQRHVSTDAIALLEDCLDALVTVSSASFTIKDC
jgi:hypothetical protein